MRELRCHESKKKSEIVEVAIKVKVTYTTEAQKAEAIRDMKRSISERSATCTRYSWEIK